MSYKNRFYRMALWRTLQLADSISFPKSLCAWLSLPKVTGKAKISSSLFQTPFGAGHGHMTVSWPMRPTAKSAVEQGWSTGINRGCHTKHPLPYTEHHGKWYGTRDQGASYLKARIHTSQPPAPLHITLVRKLCPQPYLHLFLPPLSPMQILHTSNSTDLP